MRTVVAYPGNMAHAQQSARALMEVDALEAYVTTFSHRRDGALASCLRRIPARSAWVVSRQLERRAIDQVPARLVYDMPTWEVLRTLAVQVGAGPVAADRIWDRMCRSFDEAVARHHVPRCQAVMAFEYTALAAFERARQRGVARLLQLPSLDSRETELILRFERGLAAPSARDRYFDGLFEARYARRRREIEAADVIIANSDLTAQSHVAAGADPSKVVVVPLAAPPVPTGCRFEPDRSRPLSVLWAGNFTAMKGARHLLEAWRRLAPGGRARLHVYGAVDPAVAGAGGAPDGIAFHGSVPRPALFAAYGAADVLVFPTLADGFGSVVLEAMAHGLPVIASDRAGAACFVTASNGVIVPAADPRALADALRRCLDDRDGLAAMREGARQTARARQWGHYRADLVVACAAGLARAGYAPAFRSPP